MLQRNCHTSNWITFSLSTSYLQTAFLSFFSNYLSVSFINPFFPKQTCKFCRYPEDSYELNNFIPTRDLLLEIYCLKDNLPSIAVPLHQSIQTHVECKLFCIDPLLIPLLIWSYTVWIIPVINRVICKMKKCKDALETFTLLWKQWFIAILH